MRISLPIRTVIVTAILAALATGCPRTESPEIRRTPRKAEPEKPATQATDKDDSAATNEPSAESSEPEIARPLDPIPVDTVDVVIGEGHWPERTVRVSVGGRYRVTSGDRRWSGAGLNAPVRWVPDPNDPDRYYIVVGRRTVATQPGHEVTIDPLRDGDLAVDGRRYRGAAVFRTVSAGRGLAIDRLPLEDYVAGVVGSEMPGGFGLEALKAQAVAVRSYTVYRIAETGGPLYAWHTVDQAYKGLAAERADVRRAVAATRGEVLTWNGKWFKAFYHSTCGGRTRPAEAVFPVAPIRPLSGAVCRWCRHAPRYRARSKLTRADLQRVLAGRKIRGAVVTGVSASGGTVTLALRKDGRETSVTLPADAFRMAVGPGRLYSPRIEEVIPVEGGWVFRTRGFGHGVGLCQYGADGQSRAGRGYREILGTYYPGAIVGRRGP